MERFYIIKKESLIDFFIVFFIFDLLFLPNFLASTPVSFFLLVLMSPLLFLIKKRYLLLYLLLLIVMLASVINGLTVYSVGTEDNLKRLMQMALVLALIFLNFEKVNFLLVERLINKLVLVFIFYLLIFLIFSLIIPDLYVSVMGVLSPNSIGMITANVEMFRFSYMFSDPNTLGYLLVFVAIYHLFYVRNTKITLFVFFIIFILVLSTQSRGALLAFICVSSLIVLSRTRLSLNTIRVSFFILVFSSLFVLIFQDFFSFIIDAFEKRSEIEESMGTGLGGGRDKKYYYFLNNFSFNLYGVGYSLFIDGLEFRPHSDLIRIVLSYGFFFFILFSSLFVPNNFRNTILLFSFMFPFLLNSVVDDYRLFGVFVMLFLFMKYDKRLKV
jgi:hypothetical protein